jgi:hypothetical protein
VQDIIEISRNVYVFGDVVMVKLEMFVFEKMGDVLKVSSNEVIHSDYIIALCNKPVAQMGS